MSLKICLTALTFGLAAALPAAAQTDIWIDINGARHEAVIEDTTAGKSLLEKLPLEVVLNDSDNDFCGSIPSLNFDPQEEKNGYRNGELSYWVPGSDFVIFVSGEETSQATSGIVRLGELKVDSQTLGALRGTLKVRMSWK